MRNDDGSLVGGQTWGRTSFGLIATYGRGARASVAEAGASYNRGHLFELYRRAGSWNQRLVLPIDLESTSTGWARCRARGLPLRSGLRPSPVERSRRRG